MAIYREDIKRIDLDGGIIDRNSLPVIIGENDVLENHFGVSVYRDGVPVDLSGVTCIGYFIRPNQDTVMISDGTVTGNTAFVTLPQACYAYTGHFTLAIKLVGGGVTGTLRIIDGTVANTTSGPIVDPGHTVPDITELLALINQMETLLNSLHPMTNAEIDAAMVL